MARVLPAFPLSTSTNTPTDLGAHSERLGGDVCTTRKHRNCFLTRELIPSGMRALWVVTLLFGVACRSPLGECGVDDVARLPIVFDAKDGVIVPMYAGQALTLQYCATCHSEGAPKERRGNAPVGFNFDLQPLHEDCPGETREAACLEGQRRLRTADTIMQEYRQLSWNEIDQERMPPVGTFEEDANEGNSRFFQRIEEGEPVDPLPNLSDPLSRDLMRQWLACGGPVVGPVQGLDGAVNGKDPGDLCEPVDDEGEEDGFYGICVVGAPPAQPLTPEWSTVFGYLVANCAEARCHGGSESPTMLDIDDTFDALVGGDSVAPACGDFPLVDPENAEGSLLLQKLNGEGPGGVPLCNDGDPMPPTGGRASAAVRDNIRAWIEAGAPRE